MIGAILAQHIRYGSLLCYWMTFTFVLKQLNGIIYTCIFTDCVEILPLLDFFSILWYFLCIFLYTALGHFMFAPAHPNKNSAEAYNLNTIVTVLGLSLPGPILVSCRSANISGSDTICNFASCNKKYIFRNLNIGSFPYFGKSCQ